MPTLTKSKSIPVLPSPPPGVHQFITNLLTQFCPLKGVQNPEECRKLLSSFFPIDNEQKMLQSLKSLKKLVNLAEPYKLVMSSGENLILIYPMSDKVLKIFGRGANIKPELEASKKFPDILVPIEGHISNNNVQAIVYKQLVPLSSMYLNSLNAMGFEKLLLDVAEDYDTLHSALHLHGDPGHSNIAFDGIRNRYVLMDLEDIRGSASPEKIFNEIVQLLEDLIINVDQPQYKSFLKELLERFKNENTTIKTVTKNFLGKERIRNITEVHYVPGQFGQFLLDFRPVQ